MLRKLHRIATLLCGVQILIWTGTGFAFSWFNFDQIRGGADRAPAAPLLLEATKISVDEAVHRAQQGGDVLLSVELKPLAGHPTYLVRFAERPPLLIDAADGRVRSPLSLAESAAIAQANSRSRVGVASSMAVAAAPDLPKPTHRITLSDPRQTEVFVDPSSGEILAWRNTQWRWFDRLWSLHVLGYISRDHPAHPAMRLVGGLALVVAISGALLWILTWRRREAK